MRSLIQYLALALLILSVLSACGRMETRALEGGQTTPSTIAMPTVEASATAYPAPPADNTPLPTEVIETIQLPPTAVQDISRLLLAPHRDRLRVCVEIHPKVPGDHALMREQIARNIVTIRNQDLNWPYGDTPELERCPPEMPSLARFDGVHSPWRRLTTIEEASPYRTVIYVVDDQILRDVMNAKKVASIAVEDIAYSDDDIGTITSGLVVSYNYLDNPNFIGYYLPQSLGLSGTYVNTGE